MAIRPHSSREEIDRARDERRGRVLVMTQQGMSALEIAAVLRITERTVTRDRAAVGVARPPQPRLTDVEIARAATLLDDGCSYSEVARTLGRAYSTIADHFPGRGMSIKEASELGVFARRMHREMRKQIASYATNPKAVSA